MKKASLSENRWDEWERRLYVSSPNALSTDLNGEVVILDLNQNAYFGMEEVGAFIWERLQPGISGQDLKDALLSEFEVDNERCERDLVALLKDLHDHELIAVRDTDESSEVSEA
jgi:hypothetical protein